MMIHVRYRLICVLVFFCCTCSFGVLHCQTLGGNAAYNFLKLPNSPQLAALGSVNVSNITSDAGLSFANPSLLRSGMDRQLVTSFNSLYAGIKNYSALYVQHIPEWETTVAGSLQFLNYGTVTQTDAAGNRLGNFRPADFVLQLSAARSYLARWHYGGTIKLISSNYGLYKSSAIAMDAAVSYYDSSRLLQASLVLKNMGTQIKPYQQSSPDDLPFDIQIGITKRLAKAPLQFSITAYQLHRFNLNYNDTSFNNENGIRADNKKFTLDKLFQHVVFSTQLFITDKLEVSLGYNHLLRRELIISNSGNGLTGISFGVGALFKKMQIRYARSHYQNNTGFNQLGVNLLLKQL